jgi:uncharacterized membrane protein
VYENYLDVPWYRRSGPIGTITFLGLFVLPAAIFSCIVALTGDIYTKKKDESGKLVTWSFGNKVAAVIILIIVTGLYALMWTGRIAVQ